MINISTINWILSSFRFKYRAGPLSHVLLLKWASALAARTRPPQPVAPARERDRTETSLGRPRAQPTTHNKSDADARHGNGDLNLSKGLSHHSLTFDHFSLEEDRQ